MVTLQHAALKAENKGQLKSLLPNFGLTVRKVKSNLYCLHTAPKTSDLDIYQTWRKRRQFYQNS